MDTLATMVRLVTPVDTYIFVSHFESFKLCISAYFRAHGLKVQLVFLPNGMIGSIFIASMRHNDNAMVNMSNLNGYLETILSPFALPPHGLFLPALYADGIFASDWSAIIPRYRRPNLYEQRINARMSGMRQIEEHCFADHNNLFRLIRTPYMLSLFRSGEYTMKLIFSSFLLQNCYYCMNETRSRIFGLRPPTLEGDGGRWDCASRRTDARIGGAVIERCNRATVGFDGRCRIIRVACSVRGANLPTAGQLGRCTVLIGTPPEIYEPLTSVEGGYDFNAGDTLSTIVLDEVDVLLPPAPKTLRTALDSVNKEGARSIPATVGRTNDVNLRFATS